MIDRQRKQEPPTRASQPSFERSPREDDIDRPIDRASVADDRGLGADRDRRSFGGDREHDELGSAIEDIGFDASDDEIGGSDNTER